MLTDHECGLVYERAYVPEHLPDYVTAVSEAEPFLHGDYLCYLKGRHLIFIGYTLGGGRDDTADAYEKACRRFSPTTVAVMGPRLWFKDLRLDHHGKDMYFRLDLPLTNLRQELAYMVRRAAREVRVLAGRYGEEHHRLVQAFAAEQEIGPGHKAIFLRIPAYLESSRSARLVEARRGKELIAFVIADLGSATHAFYLFSFRSLTERVPGVSDLLFYELAQRAHAAGKGTLNLGLGITPGVRRFKEKWGAVPFVPYESALVRRRRPGLLGILAHSGQLAFLPGLLSS